MNHHPSVIPTPDSSIDIPTTFTTEQPHENETRFPAYSTQDVAASNGWGRGGII